MRDQRIFWFFFVSDFGKGVFFFVRICRRTLERGGGQFCCVVYGVGSYRNLLRLIFLVVEVFFCYVLDLGRDIGFSLGFFWELGSMWLVLFFYMDYIVSGNKFFIGVFEFFFSGYQFFLFVFSLQRSEGINGRVLQVETKVRVRGEFRAFLVSQDIFIIGQTDEVLGIYG